MQPTLQGSNPPKNGGYSPFRRSEVLDLGSWNELINVTSGRRSSYSCTCFIISYIYFTIFNHIFTTFHMPKSQTSQTTCQEMFKDTALHWLMPVTEFNLLFAPRLWVKPETLLPEDVFSYPFIDWKFLPRDAIYNDMVVWLLLMSQVSLVRPSSTSLLSAMLCCFGRGVPELLHNK